MRHSRVKGRREGCRAPGDPLEDLAEAVKELTLFERSLQLPPRQWTAEEQEQGQETS